MHVEFLAVTVSRFHVSKMQVYRSVKGYNEVFTARTARFNVQNIYTFYLQSKIIYFTFIWPCIITNFFIIKPSRCTNFTNLFWHETPHVSSIIRSLFTVHSAMLYVIQDMQDQDGTAVPSWSCPKAVYKPVWHIPLLSVQWINSWWWTDELSETCRVSCQNKFVKLVHLVGFIKKK